MAVASFKLPANVAECFYVQTICIKRLTDANGKTRGDSWHQAWQRGRLQGNSNKNCWLPLFAAYSRIGGQKVGSSLRERIHSFRDQAISWRKNLNPNSLICFVWCLYADNHVKVNSHTLVLIPDNVSWYWGSLGSHVLLHHLSTWPCMWKASQRNRRAGGEIEAAAAESCQKGAKRWGQWSMRESTTERPNRKEYRTEHPEPPCDAAHTYVGGMRHRGSEFAFQEARLW